MAEQGKVRKKADKAFAHASRASGADVFVPPPTVQRLGLKDGDLIEFDVKDDPKKAGSFMADNVRVITAAELPAPPKPPELGVDFVWGNPRVEDIDIGGGVPKPQLVLPVWVTVRENKAPAIGVEVVMEPDGGNAVYGSDLGKTTGKGQAFFQLQLAETAANATVTARVNGHNYSEYWQKEQPKAVSKPEPKVAKAIKVFELGKDGAGFTTFRVVTLSSDQPEAEGTNCECIVEGAKPFEGIEPPDDSVTTSLALRFATSAEGWTMVRLRGDVEVYFRLAHNPLKTAGPYRLQPPEAKAAPTRPPGPPQPHFIIRPARTGANGTMVDFCLPENTKGTVRVVACQPLKINGTLMDPVSRHESDDRGRLTLRIEVDNDESVLFEHEESAQQLRRLLLKNRV